MINQRPTQLEQAYIDAVRTGQEHKIKKPIGLRDHVRKSLRRLKLMAQESGSGKWVETYGPHRF